MRCFGDSSGDFGSKDDRFSIIDVDGQQVSERAAFGRPKHTRPPPPCVFSCFDTQNFTQYRPSQNFVDFFEQEFSRRISVRNLVKVRLISVQSLFGRIYPSSKIY